MQPLDILLIVAIVPAALTAPTRTRRPADWWRWLTRAALGCLVLQAAFGWPRWQFVLSYAVAAWLLVRVWRSPVPAESSGRRQIWTIARTLLLVTCLALTVVLAVGVPVFVPPVPSGPNAVGRVRFIVDDGAPIDPLAADGRARRVLPILAWYPAKPLPGTRPEAFWPDAPVVVPAALRLFGLPRLNPLAHLRSVRSHSYPDAPLTNEHPRYPVLVFSHGYGSTPWQNTIQMEELASHGFIVFSVGHPFESAGLLFPDGHLVQGDAQRMRAVFAQARESRTSSSEGSHRLLDQSLELWVQDIGRLVDHFEAIDDGTSRDQGLPSALMAHRLDRARIGVFGMSFGGSAAGEFCLRDDRCVAALNMDGRQHGRAEATPLGVPLLYFVRDGSTLNDESYERSTGDRYRVEVTGARHWNFSDASLAAPILETAGLVGSIDGRRMETLLTAYTLAFFDRYLRDGRWPLLFSPPSSAGFPEVVLSSRLAPIQPPTIRLSPPGPGSYTRRSPRP